jgi:hypothetical protein
MSNMYEMTESPYKMKESCYFSQYSSPSLNLYRGNDNPGQAYNEVFGSGSTKNLVRKCTC